MTLALLFQDRLRFAYQKSRLLQVGFTCSEYFRFQPTKNLEYSLGLRYNRTQVPNQSTTITTKSPRDFTGFYLTPCSSNVTVRHGNLNIFELHTDRTVTTLNELDLLFSLMFNELLNGSSKVVSKSSAVSTADAPNQRQQHTTPLSTYTTPAPTCQVLTQVPTVASTENINQVEMVEEYAQVENDEFINIFCTPVQDRRETSSRHADSLNMHTFYQRYPSEHRWTKVHPLEQVTRNPLQSVRTRRQLESDGEMCMFALTVSQTEPKNIKEAMANFAWIESMQEELHQFDRLDVWELVGRPLCTLKWL
nr:hypothetical protein [Tanacetum cinerariifolium]